MPSDLFDAAGKPKFGVYEGTIQNAELYGYAGLELPDFLKKFRHKRWRFQGIFSPKVIAGAAIVDIGYVGSVFAYAFDMETKKRVEYSAEVPFARGVKMCDGCVKGEISFEKDGNKMEMKYGMEGGAASLFVEAHSKGEYLLVDARFAERKETVVPHQVVFPTFNGSFAFTHKSAGMPTAGKIFVGAKAIFLDPANAFAEVDHTAGVHDRHWEWRWAALGCVAESGARIGLNLVEPITDEKINENAIWINGARVAAGRADFTFSRNDHNAPWRVKTVDGKIDLSFTPYGERSADVNALIIKSRFRQPVGVFNGVITGPDGGVHKLIDAPGVVEDHESKW